MHHLIILLLTTSLYAAIYDVPVPQDLAGSSRWIPAYAQAKRMGNQLNIVYQLPVDLVGNGYYGNHPFRATGTIETGAFVPVKGESVKGTCMLSHLKPVVCVLVYPGLEIDKISRDIALQSNFFGDELIRRNKVVRLFGADPAGLLTVELE